MTASGEFGVYWTGHGTDRSEGVHGRLYGSQQPDLQVSLNDDKAKAAPGDTIVYTITYANVGNVDATGVVLTQSLPFGATYNAAQSTVGWTAGADGTYNFDVGVLAAGDTPQQVVFAVTAPRVVEPGVSKLSSTVSITDDGTHGEEQTLENNLATETTPFIKRGQGKKLDVNRDGKISPNDALIVINRMSKKGSDQVDFTSQHDEDVNGDGRVSSLDALIVINNLSAAINLAESIESHDRFIASLVPCADKVDQVLDKSKELDDVINLLAKGKRF